LKKKFDILVIGELNVDLILNGLPSLPEEGKEILAEEMTLTLGSSAAIFASNASTLGNRVAFLGKTGIDIFGDLVFKSLHDKNVNTDFIIRSSDDKTGATIVLNFGEDRAMVTYAGAMETLSADNIKAGQLSKARHMHVSSIFLQPGIKKSIVQIFKLAKNHGLTTSLDIQWDPAEKWDIDVEVLLPLVDVFLPNETELLALTGERELNKAIETIKPYINIMAVKMGNKGSSGITGNKDIAIEPFLNKQVVDAIGAGDSYNAGFITQYIKGASLEECLRFGNLTGAVNTTAAGGTGAYTSLEDFNRRAKDYFDQKGI
jgi:sugar/nucleoside kinase (ribokinase family)